MNVPGPLDRAAFDEGLEERISRAYEATRLARPPRPEHRWVTGYLGEPCSPVWFVAENPSLRQVEKVTDPDPSPELQWTMTAGDALFRDALVAAGFRRGGPMERGGWRCYITDVIKSAAVVKDFSALKGSERWELACAWAPVLEWELSWGRPRIVVFVGDRAERFTMRLIRERKLSNPEREWGARFRRVPHYVYVTRRPDTRRGLPRNAPARRNEFIADFGRIAGELDGLGAELRISDGTMLPLGRFREVDQAMSELRHVFRYGSGQGRFSFLQPFALEPIGPPIRRAYAEGIAAEARDLLGVPGNGLGPAGIALLERLGDLQGDEPSPRRSTTPS
ncbi:hypothetical protein AYO39_00170 [Actinobacteria bacterium SCGC AG-212-D09]|nr:hypothetical protein AYO39_00170 [Actinobacteria bacterium SCGC AG-212-D09]